LDRKEQRLRNRIITSVLVQWGHHSRKEATWEIVSSIREKRLHGCDILAFRNGVENFKSCPNLYKYDKIIFKRNEEWSASSIALCDGQGPGGMRMPDAPAPCMMII
jgi:hypothetical protein